MNEGEKMAGLETEEGILDETKSLFRAIQSEFLDLEGVVPKAFVVTNINPNNFEEVLDSYGMLMVVADGEFNDFTKTIFSMQVKKLCKVLKAPAVFFLSEAWMVMAKAPPGKDLADPETRKMAEEEMHSWGDGSLEHNPDREEVVMLSLEHKTMGKRLWTAKVQTVGGRKILGEFSEDVKFTQHHGRFVGLLE